MNQVSTSWKLIAANIAQIIGIVMRTRCRPTGPCVRSYFAPRTGRFLMRFYYAGRLGRTSASHSLLLLSPPLEGEGLGGVLRAII